MAHFIGVERPSMQPMLQIFSFGKWLVLGHYVFNLFVGNFILFHSNIGTFSDNGLLSIEDSRLPFIQLNCHR